MVYGDLSIMYPKPDSIYLRGTIGLRVYGIGLRAYLEVHCTYNLLSNCSYNPIVSPITTVTLDIMGL